MLFLNIGSYVSLPLQKLYYWYHFNSFFLYFAEIHKEVEGDLNLDLYLSPKCGSMCEQTKQNLYNYLHLIQLFSKATSNSKIIMQKLQETVRLADKTW